MRETIAEISRRARPGARVVSESQLLAAYYAQTQKRSDLICLSLSDPEALKELAVGDFMIVARGRRYFSNDALITLLSQTAKPDFQEFLGSVPSVDVYILNDTTLRTIISHR